jgi:hypothetical protein
MTSRPIRNGIKDRRPVTQRSTNGQRIARLVCLNLLVLTFVLLPPSASAEPVTLEWPQPDGDRTRVSLTYSYSNLLDGAFLLMDPTELRAATEEALRLWATYAPLHFVERRDSGPDVSDLSYSAEGHPQIRIGHHVNSDLAHAYFPGGDGLAGDVHFAVGVPWSLDGHWNFLETVTHELGHSLGLVHENAELAIMNPSYPTHRFGGLGSAYLYPSDVRQLQSIYGEGVGSVLPLSPTPEPTTYLLMVAGLVVLAGMRCHRN